MGQSEPAHTSAPTWMDGALIYSSFLSLCHPRFTFFICPFSALISVFFNNFIFSPPTTKFLFSFPLETSPPPLPPPPSPTDLLTYMFKQKVNSSQSTYSPINKKCVTLSPTYMTTPTYLVAIPVGPKQPKTRRKRKKALHEACIRLLLLNHP